MAILRSTRTEEKLLWWLIGVGLIELFLRYSFFVFRRVLEQVLVNIGRFWVIWELLKISNQPVNISSNFLNLSLLSVSYQGSIVLCRLPAPLDLGRVTQLSMLGLPIEVLQSECTKSMHSRKTLKQRSDHKRREVVLSQQLHHLVKKVKAHVHLGLSEVGGLFNEHEMGK
ncbi:unnamed protein product [Lactuca virosa]|uniref:Uncharacterized protein n=1 Tax=Lactuca virosa TaxID=75947 RepID=A0AAU9PCF9_9ASTR|nr:unnamed protein product [Lactuca virosa]